MYACVCVAPPLRPADHVMTRFNAAFDVDRCYSEDSRYARSLYFETHFGGTAILAHARYGLGDSGYPDL